MTKTCIACRQEKPFSAFYRHASMADGRLGRCIECHKAAVRQNRVAKIAYYRQYDKQRASAPHRVIAREQYQGTDAYRIAHNKATKVWAARFPERKAAQVAVRRAMRAGRIAPLPCWICGEKAQAHHPDYAQPLDVVWLCPDHHREAHELVKEAA